MYTSLQPPQRAFGTLPTPRHVTRSQSRDASTLTGDIDGVYSVTPQHKEYYASKGFVRLKGVFSHEPLKVLRETVAKVVTEADKTPLEDDDAYARAFVQVMNLWERDVDVRKFVFGTRLARIAAELMGVRGVRMYHDQALCKLPGGGPTPWHADQYYFPLSSDKAITAWVPLQPTPAEMGPLQFAAGSHKVDVGRHLGISGANQHIIDQTLTMQRISQGGFELGGGDQFELGEVSFHSGWTFHRADGNATSMPREVFTIIYIDEDVRMVEPVNSNQEADVQRWLPGIKPGEVCASHRNPVVWSASSKA